MPNTRLDLNEEQLALINEILDLISNPKLVDLMNLLASYKPKPKESKSEGTILIDKGIDVGVSDQL